MSDDKKQPKIGDFRRLFTPPWRASGYSQFTIGMYEAQVEREIESLRATTNPRDVDLAKKLLDWKPALGRFFQQANGHPVLCMQGSARDESIDKAVRKAILALAEKAIPKGLGRIDGHFWKGYMGLFKHAFLKAKQAAYFSKNSFDKDRFHPFLAGVPIKEGEVQNEIDVMSGKPDWWALVQDYEDELSPPFAAMGPRWSTLAFAAEVVASIFCNPGIGTGQELAHELLEKQMRKRSQTAYAYRKEALPPIILLDQLVSRGTDFNLSAWSGFMMNTLTQTASKAARAEEYGEIYVVRIGKEPWENPWEKDHFIPVKWFEKPAQAADFIMEQAWKCYCNLAAFYLSQMPSPGAQ